MDFCNYTGNPYNSYGYGSNCQEEEARRRKKRNNEDDERRRKRNQEEEDQRRKKRNKEKEDQRKKNNSRSNNSVTQSYVHYNTYVKEPKKIIDPSTQKHYVYLVRIKEDVMHNRNIYKVGKTVINVMTTSLSVLSTLGTGTELISVRQCINAVQVEEEILVMFNEKFKKVKGMDSRKQRFEGNVDEMDHTISQIVRNDRKKTIMPKEIDNLVLS